MMKDILIKQAKALSTDDEKDCLFYFNQVKILMKWNEEEKLDFKRRHKKMRGRKKKW